MSVLQMQDVCFVRHGRPIVDKVSWTIERGEHWALLGANGSGKTTLLKLLTAYEWPTSGRIAVLGNVHGESHVGLNRRNMGWVSASLQRQLPGHDTAVRVVASGIDASFGWYRDWDDDVETAARRALERLRIEHLEHQTYETLSQGEQKRVQIARTIVHEPELLILDEPCEGLDQVSRHRFLSDLSAFVGQPNAPSVIYVTHHIEELGDWITHGHILKEGRTLAQGEAAEVLNSGVLGEAFGCDCLVGKTAKGYRLDLEG